MSNQSISRVARAYIEKCKSSALDAPLGNQLAIYGIVAKNASGGNINMGIYKKLNTAAWKAYREVSAVLTEITTEIQAKTAHTLFVSDGDKLYVGVRDPASLIGLNVSTVEVTGVGSAYTYKYYNGAAFVTLNCWENPGDYTAAGENLIVFPAPLNMAAGGVVGADPTLYYIEIEATDSPDTTDPIIDEIWIGECLTFGESIADKASISVEVIDKDVPFIFEVNEGVLPYFGTKDNFNSVEVSYNVIG